MSSSGQAKLSATHPLLPPCSSLLIDPSFSEKQRHLIHGFLPEVRERIGVVSSVRVMSSLFICAVLTYWQRTSSSCSSAAIGVPSADVPDVPLLPWDVLCCIMRFVDRKSDLCCFMQACKALQELGMHILCRSCDLMCHSRSGTLAPLDSFCAFMLRDPERPLFIRSLVLPEFVIDGPNCDFSFEDLNRTATAFARIIARAKHLESLFVFSTEELLECDPYNMYRAIVSLEELKEVVFEGGNVLTARVINEMRSKPKDITIDFSTYPEPEIQPMPLISRFRDSLTDLNISMSSEDFSIHRRVTCPHVTTLALGGPCVDYLLTHSLRLEDVPEAFPAVDSLKLSSHPSDPASVEAARASTITRRANLRTPRAKWRYLNYFECSLSWAYALVVECSVGHWHGARLEGPDDIFWLHDALADMRPKQLDLAFHASYLRQCHDDLELFQGSSPTVTQLHINLVFDAAERQFEWLAEVTSRREMFVSKEAPGDLNHVPLKLFSICFEVKRAPLPSEEVDVIDVFRSQVDFDAYALKLARLLPNTEFICVQLLRDGGQQIVNVWTVKRNRVENQEDGSSEDVVLERLGDVDARQFMRETPFEKMLLWLR